MPHPDSDPGHARDHTLKGTINVYICRSISQLVRSSESLHDLASISRQSNLISAIVSQIVRLSVGTLVHDTIRLVGSMIETIVKSE